MVPAIVAVVFLLWFSETLCPMKLTVLVVLLGVLALFCSLTVEIKDLVLVCSFGPGLIRKTIHLSDIDKVLVVRNPWYAGWGIRWMPGQYWLWNVSGLQAVELIGKSGKRFRIGTNEPEALAQAIQANMAAPT
jgi:hypothetical protein